MMKPFNLEAAKAGKPIQQRNGVMVRYIAHVPDAQIHSRVVVMSENHKLVSHRQEDGKYNSAGLVGDFDLFMAPTKKTYWANVYRSNGFTFITNLYSEAIDAANEAGKMDKSCVLVKTISVEVEE
jgi:hypothetical protein